MSSMIVVESLVKLSPQGSVRVLLNTIQKHIEALDKPKITGKASLNKLSKAIKSGMDFAENLEAFLDLGREATSDAWKKVLPAEGLKVTTSITLPARTTLSAKISAAKTVRATFLLQQEEERAAKQREKDAKQTKINDKIAKAAEKSAREQGADSDTAKEIAQSVKAAPAPLVRAKVEAPADVSASWNYSVKVLNLKQLFGVALNDPSIFALVNCKNIREEFESALRSLATGQKEQFKLPGCELVKTPKDIQR